MMNVYSESVKKYIELDERRSKLLGQISNLDEDVSDLETRLKEVLDIATSASCLDITLQYVGGEIEWLDSKLMEITQKLRTTIEEYEAGDFEDVLADLEEEAYADGWDYVEEPLEGWGEGVYTKVWKEIEVV